MKTTFSLFAILIILSSPKPDCDCQGSIKYYHKGTLVKEINFQKGYYIQGEDCAIVRGERVRYDSIVIRGQVKNW